MGGGSYSFADRAVSTALYSTQSFEETFHAKNIVGEMDPMDVLFREACDSEEHPNSVPIIIALDVTASMGSVPEHIVKDALPKLIDKLMQAGIEDPQVLFLGIGDHECDRSPLQVGQFESSDALMDKWLTSVWFEKGGGGSGGESYFLAWYFAANHTKIESLTKRGQKGFLFTIGDEPTLEGITPADLALIVGGQPVGEDKITAVSCLEDAQKSYEVFHVHTNETRRGQWGESKGEINGWKELLGESLLQISTVDELVDLLSSTIIKNLGVVPVVGTVVSDTPSDDAGSGAIDDYRPL